MTAVDPGLCASCRHHRVVKGAQSDFWMCRRSTLDARFPRYPRLPVLSCVGYEKGSVLRSGAPPPSSPDSGRSE